MVPPGRHGRRLHPHPGLVLRRAVRQRRRQGNRYDLNTLSVLDMGRGKDDSKIQEHGIVSICLYVSLNVHSGTISKFLQRPRQTRLSVES